MSVRATAMLLLLAAACSASERPPGERGGSATPPPPNTGGSSSGGACREPPTADEACIGSVKGEVLDGTGLGITLPINLCSATLCFATSSDEGLFSVEVNKTLDLSTFMIHAFGYPDYSDTFVRLGRPTSATVTLAQPVYVSRLDLVGTVVPEAPQVPVNVSAGPIQITIPAGTVTTFYPAHDQRALRAGAVFDPKRFDPRIVVLYALGPFGARLSQKANLTLTLPAGSNIADGTSLEVIVLDDDLRSPDAAKIVTTGTAVVTGGVARSTGGALSLLTWVGLRAAASP